MSGVRAAAPASLALSAALIAAWFGAPAAVIAASTAASLAVLWFVLAARPRRVRGCVILLGVGAVVLAVGMSPHRRSPAGMAPLSAEGRLCAGARITAAHAAELLVRADQGRRLGDRDAPYVLELGLSIECPRCGEEWAALRPRLASAIAAGRLTCAVRHVVHPRAQASADLASWAFAAASRGRTAHERFIETMVGTRADIRAEQILHGPHAEAADLAALASEVDECPRVFETLISGDARRMHALDMVGATPTAVLLDRRGAVLGRWSMRLDPAEILAAIDGADSGDRVALKR